MQSRLSNLGRAIARGSFGVARTVLNGSKAVLLATPRKMKLGIAQKFSDFIPGAAKWEVLHKANTNKFTDEGLGANWDAYSRTLDGAKHVEFNVPRALVPIDRVHAFECYLNAIFSGEGIAEARKKNEGNSLYQLHMEFVSLGGCVEVREGSRNNQAELVIKIPLCADKEEFRERVRKAIVTLGIQDSHSVNEATERLWKQKSVDFGGQNECNHDHGHHGDTPSPPSPPDPVERASEPPSPPDPVERASEPPSPPDPVERASEPPRVRTPLEGDLASAIKGIRLRPVATPEKIAVVDAAKSLKEICGYRNFDGKGLVTTGELENLIAVSKEMQLSGALDLSPTQEQIVPKDLSMRIRVLRTECEDKVAQIESQGGGIGSSVDPLSPTKAREVGMYKCAAKAATELLSAMATVPGFARHCCLEQKQSPLHSPLGGQILNAASGMPMTPLSGESQSAPSRTPGDAERSLAQGAQGK